MNGYYTACTDPDDVFFIAVQALENPGMNDRLEQKTPKKHSSCKAHETTLKPLIFIELHNKNYNLNIFDT